MSSQIKSLPADVSEHIAGFLPYKDLGSLRQVSKATTGLSPDFIAMAKDVCSNSLKLESEEVSKLLTVTWAHELPKDPRELLKKVAKVTIENGLIYTWDAASKIVHHLHIPHSELKTLRYLFQKPAKKAEEKLVALQNLIRKAMPIKPYLALELELYRNSEIGLEVCKNNDVNTYFTNKFIRYHGDVWRVRNVFYAKTGIGTGAKSTLEVQLYHPTNEMVGEEDVIDLPLIYIFLEGEIQKKLELYT